MTLTWLWMLGLPEFGRDRWNGLTCRCKAALSRAEGARPAVAAAAYPAA